jgi:hypothetical protein
MEEQWKHDYDRRQYISMEEMLGRYEQRGIDLGSLIAGLESLLQCLELADEEWKNQFRSKWGILEEVYAVALDQIEQGAPENIGTILEETDNQRLIQNAVESIRQLLAGRHAAMSQE